jgi:hypothetical protein
LFLSLEIRKTVHAAKLYLHRAFLRAEPDKSKRNLGSAGLYAPFPQWPPFFLWSSRVFPCPLFETAFW